jgi:hypothetical protein
MEKVLMQKLDWGLKFTCSLTGPEFCFIFTIFKGCDEPEIFPCSIRQICS